MRLTITRWLGREFVFLTGEAPRCATVRDELQGIVREMEHELNRHGLALGDTVRTRLWATDRASRNEASRERRRIFDGAARSVSSSFIAPDVFSSGARVALDVVALRASPAVGPKDLHEYDPPIVPLRFLRLDSLVFLSGVTSVRATLSEQVHEIVGHITESLRDAGTDWDRVERMSCFLHRSQALTALDGVLRDAVPKAPPLVEYAFVDGYSDEGKLVEIETTARG
ncbi:MAG TPA: hypothetical protein VFC51_13130 [Chloroflexota bacterium]|nr:hypothetical protein [Chloroflexota bacterium]